MRNVMTSVIMAAVLVLSSPIFAPSLTRASEPPAPPGTVLALFGGGGSKQKSPLKKKQRELARAVLSTLGKDAHLVLFSEGDGCKKCGKAERLLTELASLSPLLTCDTLSLSENAERAAELGIDKVPGIAILNGEKKSPGIRYYGIPLGFEFEAFLEAIVNTAHDRPGLEPETVAGLSLLKKPVTITVFVTQH